jgi:dTMP kinase
VLVAVVGADGAGKSTVTSSLVAELEQRGVPARRVDRWDVVDNPHYPSARFLKPDIPDIRRSVADMPSQLRFLFLLWTIGTALLDEQGSDADPEGVVLLDGYWMKHAASEIIYGSDPRWIESAVSELPVPDLVIYMHLDPAVAWRRKVGIDLVPYECGMDVTCSQDAFIRHQQALQSLLLAWSQRDHWVKIDASLPPAEVSVAIADLVSRKRQAGGAARVDMRGAER